MAASAWATSHTARRLHVGNGEASHGHLFVRDRGCGRADVRPGGRVVRQPFPPPDARSAARITLTADRSAAVTAGSTVVTAAGITAGGSSVASGMAGARTAETGASTAAEAAVGTT